MKNRYLSILFLLFFLVPFLANGQAEEFYGSFGSWTNLRQAYPAAGNGVADDTRALQAALDELNDGRHAPVLFIPNGVYRITSTLLMKARRSIAIVGEDPEKTIIKWDGPAGQKMFALNGVAYSEYSRITWDGSNKAAVAVAHEWDGKTGPANSGTRHADEIFRNVGVGLKSGANMDAEFSIRRCRFYHCSSTAISLQGFNALDWWVWDCYFESCNAGVANDLPAFGAGNFHVYRSIFKNSATADISLGSSSFFSFRDNISYNSNCFIRARQFSNTSPITIQGNLIINRRNLQVLQLFTKGNVLILDNTFVTAPTPDSGTTNIIWMIDNYSTPPADGMLIGNRFSTLGWTLEKYGGRFVVRDNHYQTRPASFPSLDPAPFAPRVNYPVTELNNKMSGGEIQAAIDRAASSRKPALLHFSYGQYLLSQSLKIPGGAPLILYGDGLLSDLVWKGEKGQPVISVDYPAVCTIRSLHMNAAGGADGILLRDNDQEGNRIYGEELMVYNGVSTNIKVSGFSNTDIRLENLHHVYCSGNSIEVFGTGKENASVFRIFGGVSLNNANSYSVGDKARIQACDIWYEGSRMTPFLTLRGSGEFTLNGSLIGNAIQPYFPLIDIDSFSGKVVLAQIDYNQLHKKLRFSNASGHAELLNLGTLLASDSTLSFFELHSDPKNYSLLHNRYNLGKGSIPLPDKGDTSYAFLEKMLSTLRKNTVAKPKPPPPGRSHFTLDRVMIEGGVNNFRIERSDKAAASAR